MGILFWPWASLNQEAYVFQHKVFIAEMVSFYPYLLGMYTQGIFGVSGVAMFMINNLIFIAIAAYTLKTHLSANADGTAGSPLVAWIIWIALVLALADALL